jgi:RNA recognition motif-containing protein
MKNLYVGNLPHSTTEAELRTAFEAHGAVAKVNIVTDRETGRSRGFAFVEMTDASEADKAIATLHGSDLGGRTLKINEAKPKADGPRSDRSRSDGARSDRARTGGTKAGGQRFGGGGGGRGDDYHGHARQPREPRW